MAQNSNVSRSQEDYIPQVSEEIEDRVTKKLFQEFNRTENRVLGALSRLGDFIINPLIQGHSGTAPEASWNAFSTSQGTNEDDSVSDPHPEAGIFHNECRSTPARHAAKLYHQERQPKVKKKLKQFIIPTKLSL